MNNSVPQSTQGEGSPPPIPKELVEHLREVFPDTIEGLKIPVDPELIAKRLGHLEVLAYLSRSYEQQQEDSVINVLQQT